MLTVQIGTQRQGTLHCEASMLASARAAETRAVHAAECHTLQRAPGSPRPGLDNAFPVPAAGLATSLEGFDIASVQQQRQEQSYFVRLGSLSERLRQRAYEHSLGKLQRTRQRAQDALLQLAQALSLVRPGGGAGGGRARS